MIIVSQDEKGIINFDNVPILYIKQKDNMHGIFYFGIEMQGALGWYKTEERAKEILDEIVKSINSKLVIITNKLMRENEKKYWCKQNENLLSDYNNTIIDYAKDIKPIPGNTVYYMPEE